MNILHAAPPAQTTLRPVTDFFIGLGIFMIVTACIAVTGGLAATGPTEASSWVTTVALTHDAAGSGWHNANRDAALLLLALTFGGLTAFNMSIARHLRAVAIAAKAVGEPEQPGHPSR